LPGIFELARQCRQLQVRAVRYLAGEAGVRQFLDVGAGLPAMAPTHQVAQGIAPEAKVIYLDNDPIALDHARSLLADASPTALRTTVTPTYSTRTRSSPRRATCSTSASRSR
jgi:hypothetical protein